MTCNTEPDVPSSVFRFSTDALPERDRTAIWREVVGREYMCLDIEPIGEKPVWARIEVHHLPTMQFTELESSAARYTRTGTARSADDPDFTLVRGLRNDFRFLAARQDESLAAGDLMLLCNHQRGTIEVADDVRTLTIRIDGGLLRAASRDSDEHPGRRLDAESPPMRLLVDYVDAVLGSGPLDPGLDQVVLAHLVDLIALGLRPRVETLERAPGGAVRAARLAAIRADVLANLAAAGLSARSMARRHGLSERYVQLLFEQSGVTFARFVLEHRLRRAMRMLVDPGCATMRISDIAFAVGFSDLSTFNRTFRQRFGATPREARGASGQQV